MFPSIAMCHYQFIKQSFVYTQTNDQTVLFLTIQFSISHLFAYIVNFKQFYLSISRILLGATSPGPSEPGVNGTLHSPELQGWSLTIRLFNIISRILIMGMGLTLMHFTAPADWANMILVLLVRIFTKNLLFNSRCELTCVMMMCKKFS